MNLETKPFCYYCLGTNAVQLEGSEEWTVDAVILCEDQRGYFPQSREDCAVPRVTATEPTIQAAVDDCKRRCKAANERMSLTQEDVARIELSTFKGIVGGYTFTVLKED